MIESTSQAIVELFDKYGTVPLAFLAVTADGRSFGVPYDGTDNLSDEYFAAARMLFREVDAVRCVLISEAYVVAYADDAEWQAATGGDYQRCDPANDPNGKEVILIHGEDIDDGLIGAYREINRPADGRPMLGPLVFLPKPGLVQGTAVGFLPQKSVILS